MVAGLSVPVVTERIEWFEAQLETLTMRHERQADSERLFGLPVTDYPQLRLIGRELGLLRRLYDLYNDVSSTIHGYFDVQWHDVDVEKITDQLRQFQNRFRAAILVISYSGRQIKSNMTLIAVDRPQPSYNLLKR